MGRPSRGARLPAGRCRAPDAAPASPFVHGRFAQAGDGATANRYHEAFSAACGFDSLRELALAGERGAAIHVGAGFLTRNASVAWDATHVLAQTFGAGDAPTDFLPDDPGLSSSVRAGLKDGGTAGTWRSAWRSEAKRHVPLFAVLAGVEAARAR